MIKQLQLQKVLDSIFDMKFVLVLVCVAFLALAAAVDLPLSEEQTALAKANSEQCMQEEGITKEQAAALRGGNFEDSDPKVKCFANCFLEKTGFMADGQIKPDVVLAKLGPLVGEDATKVVQAKCDSIKGADKCDTAYQLFQCYHKNHAHV